MKLFNLEYSTLLLILVFSNISISKEYVPITKKAFTEACSDNIDRGFRNRGKYIQDFKKKKIKINNPPFVISDKLDRKKIKRLDSQSEKSSC